MTTASAPLAPPAPATSPHAQTSVARLARGVLGYTVAVILFGAWVRISGSGAGCGQHWPTCNGEVVHLPRSVETAIELTHRVTSGVSVLLVLGLAALAFRRFSAGHLVRRAAALATVTMFGEALVGAALVLLRLVGHDESMARAGVMSLHLVNTCFLVGSLTVLGWAAARPDVRALAPARGFDRLGLLAAALLLVVASSGAVTALGDTLHPVAAGGLGEHVAADQAEGVSALVRMRALHPVLAVCAAALWLWLAPRIGRARGEAETERAGRWVVALVLLQVGAGVVNVSLSAPGWMQIVHLALSNALWIGVVLLLVEARRRPAVAQVPG